jgi:DNA-binding transcriptional LysR family regulator
MIAGKGQRFAMIENRHLRYFAVLAKTLHMTRAAERLHIAQPALTQNIQQLEEELGTLLIRRTGRKLSLTEAGKVFLTEAKRSLQQFEFAKIAAQRAGRGEAGQVAIGFGSTAGLSVVPQMVKAFREKYPDVQVILREMGSDAQIAALRSGDIDLAIAYALPDREFQYMEMTPESLVAVLPEHHQLARNESVSIKELAQDSFILPAQNIAVTLQGAVLAECADAGFKPKYIQEAHTSQTALGLVAAGLGVSIQPASIRKLRRDGVVFLPLRNTRIEVRLLMQWKRDDVSVVVQNLLTCI